MELKLRDNLFPVDIVMITWNRPELTRKAIMGINQNTKRENFTLIVIDNGSEPEMQRELLALASQGFIDQLHLLEENIGLEPARNIGMSFVESEYFVCADNDIIPQKIKNGEDWVEKLVKLMEKYPEYGAISCRTQVMIGTGNIFDGHEDEEIVDFPHPGGSLRIMPTTAVLDAGLWRDDNPGRGQEERYICGKLHDLDYKTGFATKIKCLHLFGDETTDRWGYDKEWKPEASGHSDIWHPVLERGDDPEEVRQYYDGE